MTILQRVGVGILICGGALSAVAKTAPPVETATLKDLQTVGSTSKKQKHQQYDLILDTSTNEYTCRTKLGSTMKPTEFVVGSQVEFQIDGQNGSVKNTAGNKIKCGIVRVAGVAGAQ